MWCTQQGLVLLFGFAKGFLTPFETTQAMLLFAAVSCAELTSFWCAIPLVGALSARIVANIMIFPRLWESHLWCAETDCSLVLALVGALLPRASAPSFSLVAKNELAERVAITVRWQLALFYNGAAFWKLNTSFIDHRYSCAPLFFASILAAYLPDEVATPQFTSSILRAAPMIILVGEFAIAITLLIAAWGHCKGVLASACSKIGVGLALCLHLGIALTPPPNNVGAFSGHLHNSFLYTHVQHIGALFLHCQANVLRSHHGSASLFLRATLKFASPSAHTCTTFWRCCVLGLFVLGLVCLDHGTRKLRRTFRVARGPCWRGFEG